MAQATGFRQETTRALAGALEIQPWHRLASLSISTSYSRRSYIARQEERHRKKTFQEEYLELLHRCGVDFDERYLW